MKLAVNTNNEAVAVKLIDLARAPDVESTIRYVQRKSGQLPVFRDCRVSAPVEGGRVRASPGGKVYMQN